MKRKRIVAKTLLLAWVINAWALSAATAEAKAEPSRVLRFTVPTLVQNRYDVVVTLYHRNGKFHMGYAELPDRDNIVHRIDVTPSLAIAFVDNEGKEISVPEEARGYYSYKNKIFLRFKERYNKGDIDIVHTSKASPIQWKNKQLAGLMDLKINHVDAVNGVGRSNGSLIYRLDINAAEKNGSLTGKAVCWMYAKKDDDYGKANPKTTVDITGKWIADHWKAKPGSEYAKGKDWPMAHGPNLTGAAVDCKTPLVNTLHDARLVWVADLPLGSGRGGGLMRGDFCMYPISWTTLWEAGYGGPIMADNKVFVYAPSPDLEAIEKHPKLERNPYYRLGAKPGLLASSLSKQRDSVLAFDARSGALLWRYDGKPGGASHVGGKSGKASTPCYYKGKVYIRGGGGVICLDASTGDKIWQVGYGLSRGASDASVTQVGGTLILVTTDDNGSKTVGLDPKDGDLKWTIDGAGAPGYGIGGLYREGGKEYLVLGHPAPNRKRKDKSKVTPKTFMLADPVDGRILWESDALAYNYNQIVVIGDVAIGNVKDGDPKAKNSTSSYRIGGVKISTKGAKRLWVNEKVHPQPYRNMAIAKQAVYYSDSRVTGFTATDVRSGELLAKRPDLYTLSHVSHNWSWQIGSNDRILSEGIIMYSTAGRGLELLPGRLGNAVSGGYRSPTKPLIADGRFIFRMGDKLACYDLRMHPEAARTEVITLTAEKAAVAGPNTGDVKVRIRKRGDKLISLGGKAPHLTSPDTRLAVTWGPMDWSAPSYWRTVIPHDLKLTADSLKGAAKVRLGYQYEPFEFDLKRDGDSFSGSYTRTIKPLDKPIKSQGDVVGPIVTKPDGSRYFVVYLSKAGCSVGALRSGTPPHAGIWIIVSVDKNDKVTAVSSCAGRMNLMTHEVDVHELTVRGNAVKGKVTVITHDDRYGDFDYKSAQSEFRVVGEGGAIAMQFSFESTGVEIKDEKTGKMKLENKGAYTGVIGVPWKRSGTISGKLVSETAP